MVSPGCYGVHEILDCGVNSVSDAGDFVGVEENFIGILSYTVPIFIIATIYTEYIWPQTKLKEKGRDLTQSHDKSPYTNRKIQKAKWQHKSAIKNYDYTTIADWLRTVNLSDDSHLTGVVKPVYGIPTIPWHWRIIRLRNEQCVIRQLNS